MNEQKHNAQVFDAGSVPRRRQLPQQHFTFKRCLLVFASIGTIIGIIILALAIKALNGLLHDLQWPHPELVHNSADNKSASYTIRPLLDSKTPFDILGTVWLDVTQHLNDNKSIPPEFQVVNYTQWNGTNRKEIVLYEQILFKDVKMKSRLHTSVKIRVPIEPIYSQRLGPSSLRATLQLMPRNVSRGLQINGSVSVYPPFLPIGPRSLHSWKLNKNTSTPYTLDNALENSAININLLTLLPTKWRFNQTQPNIHLNTGKEPSMFDGSPASRAFQKPSNNTAHFFINRNHRVMLPHIRTRSSIILLNEERKFRLDVYWRKRQSTYYELDAACTQFKGKVPFTFLDKACARPYQGSMYENLLRFQVVDQNMTGNVSKVRYFYAPFLTQHISSSAYRHHRTIPGFTPNANSEESKAKTKRNAEEECLIPMLNKDPSEQFFEFDWDVAYSSHTHKRATLAETGSFSYEPSLQDLKNNGSEIRIEADLVERTQWNLQALGFADQEHPDSKPWISAIRHSVVVVSQVTFHWLNIVYWFTRSTSRGLSRRAVFTSIASNTIQLFKLLNLVIPTGWLSTAGLSKMFQISSTSLLILLKAAKMLHIELDGTHILRRPPTKQERISERRDALIGWWLPASLIGSLYLFLNFADYFNLHLVPGKGCSDSKISLQGFRILDWAILKHAAFALTNSSMVIQIIFNSKAGTFAGYFKINCMLSLAADCLKLSAEGFERIGGWQPIRAPILTNDIVRLFILATLIFQAILFPGISQAVLEEDEDEV